MSLLLTDKLPLVLAQRVSGAIDTGPLAMVFGDMRERGIPTKRIGELRFAVASHPMQVTGAAIDGSAAQVVASVEKTESGEQITVMELSEPPEDGQTVVAYGLGLRDSAGALIESPADILAYLYSLAGITPDIEAFSLACDAEQIKLAGCFTEQISIRKAIIAVAQQVGALVSGSTVRMLPVTDAPLYDLTQDAIRGVSCQIVASDYADTLALGYDADADNNPARYVVQSAKESPQLEIVKDVAAPWLRNPATATKVAARLFGWHCATRARVTFSTDSRLTIGELASVSHPILPEPMTGLVVSSEPNGADVRYTGIAIVQTKQVLRTARTAGGNLAQSGAVGVSITDGVATFTIQSPDGKILVGAKCRLDDSPTKRTDQQGRVSFTAKRGAHTLHVEADGYSPFTMEVTL